MLPATRLQKSVAAVAIIACHFHPLLQRGQLQCSHSSVALGEALLREEQHTHCSSCQVSDYCVHEVPAMVLVCCLSYSVG